MVEENLSSEENPKKKIIISLLIIYRKSFAPTWTV
jgi:hypothetical protein